MNDDDVLDFETWHPDGVVGIIGDRIVLYGVDSLVKTSEAPQSFVYVRYERDTSLTVHQRLDTGRPFTMTNEYDAGTHGILALGIALALAAAGDCSIIRHVGFPPEIFLYDDSPRSE